MNAWDKNNLRFLMNSSPEQLRDWVQSVSEDDLDYAMELLRMAMAEMDVQILEYNDDVEDLTEAQQLLNKIMKMK